MPWERAHKNSHPGSVGTQALPSYTAGCSGKIKFDSDPQMNVYFNTSHPGKVFCKLWREEEAGFQLSWPLGLTLLVKYGSCRDKNRNCAGGRPHRSLRSLAAKALGPRMLCQER